MIQKRKRRRRPRLTGTQDTTSKENGEIDEFVADALVLENSGRFHIDVTKMFCPAYGSEPVNSLDSGPDPSSLSALPANPIACIVLQVHSPNPTNSRTSKKSLDAKTK